MCLNCNKAVFLHTTLRCPTFWECNLGKGYLGLWNITWLGAWQIRNSHCPVAKAWTISTLCLCNVLHISNVSLHPLALQLKPIIWMHVDIQNDTLYIVKCIHVHLPSDQLYKRWKIWSATWETTHCNSWFVSPGPHAHFTYHRPIWGARVMLQ